MTWITSLSTDASTREIPARTYQCASSRQRNIRAKEKIRKLQGPRFGRTQPKHIWPNFGVAFCTSLREDNAVADAQYAIYIPVFGRRIRIVTANEVEMSSMSSSVCFLEHKDIVDLNCALSCTSVSDASTEFIVNITCALR